MFRSNTKGASVLSSWQTIKDYSFLIPCIMYRFFKYLNSHPSLYYALIMGAVLTNHTVLFASCTYQHVVWGSPAPPPVLLWGSEQSVPSLVSRRAPPLPFLAILSALVAHQRNIFTITYKSAWKVPTGCVSSGCFNRRSPKISSQYFDILYCWYLLLRYKRHSYEPNST